MMTGCNYHAKPKDGCLLCRLAPAYDAARTDWLDRCPHCSSADLRNNVTCGVIWCGQCGAQAKLIDRTIALVRKMRGSNDVSHVVADGEVQ